MSVKNILVAYNGEAARGSGLRHAARVAKHHDAYLTGVLRHGVRALESRFAGQIPQNLIEFLDEAEAEHTKVVSKRFTDAAAAAGLADQSEFVDLADHQGSSLTSFARHFDLIVTGPVPNVTEEHLAADPNTLTLETGRPVLVVPDEYEADSLATHAIVAWDGKRCAARALGDAMSILEEQAKVTILEVGREEVPGTDVLMRNLKRHGINAELMTRPRNRSVAKTLVEATEETGAKLLVMGAFEHSRFQHDLLGGATTDILKMTPVPVFMSH